jgi:serine/threonine protein kinase
MEDDTTPLPDVSLDEFFDTEGPPTDVDIWIPNPALPLGAFLGGGPAPPGPPAQTGARLSARGRTAAPAASAAPAPSARAAAAPAKELRRAPAPPLAGHDGGAFDDDGDDHEPTTGPPPVAYDLSVISSAEGSLPALGSTIDKYRIEALVGSGGFAVVYRARHLLLDKPVALKILRPQVARRRPDLAALMCEEARFVARINHPNVVRIHDVTHGPQLTYLVLEFIQGAALSDIIRTTGRLPWARVLRIGLDVAAGLKAGQQQGIIHRDIKPANVLIGSDGIAKIVDLGLAHATRDRGVELGGLAGASAGTSRPAGLVGTPGYAAPEQVENPVAVDFRADIFSLGVTMLHAILGRPPFSSRAPSRHVRLPPAAEVQPALPPRLYRLFEWMLAPQPERRPASYDEVAGEMTRSLEQLAPAF